MVENSENNVTLKDLTANATPLGLLGFGLTTVLLNLHNAGFYPLDSMILAMGITYGGIAQIFACWMKYKKGNTFGTVAFGSYGLFWWSFVLILILPKLGLATAPDPTSLASYLFMWGLFTLMMFFASLKHNRGLQVIVGALAILFFLLAAGEFTGNPNITLFAGFEGIFTGLSAVYVGLAMVINDSYQKNVLPV